MSPPIIHNLNRCSSGCLRYPCIRLAPDIAPCPSVTMTQLQVVTDGVFRNYELCVSSIYLHNNAE